MVFRRSVVLVAIAVGLVAVGAAAAHVGTRVASIVVYPDSQTIPANGVLPAGSAHAVLLNEPIGGDGTGLIVVSSANQIAATIHGLAGLNVQFRFWHFVNFGGRLVPDALIPWDGSTHSTEEPNQPFSIEVSIPYNFRAGVYRGAVTVAADASTVTLPITVTVFPVRLPTPGQRAGSLLTVFGVGPQAYVQRKIDLYHLTDDQIRTVNADLFAFLSTYRISPDSWGYGIPHAPTGYASPTDAGAWFRDDLDFMVNEMSQGRFSTLWIPLSDNRATPNEYIAGLSPYRPDNWCSYLTAVRQFWQQHGWLASGAIPYVYGYDEPGYTQTTLLAQQATVTHRCWPGAKVLVTANPSPTPREMQTMSRPGDNSQLWNSTGPDQVDIWSVVDWRYYGLFTPPILQQRNIDRSHMYLRAINRARAHGKLIFTYTYAGPPGIPSFRATEPLSDPRMFVLWSALEGINGILYGDGMTTYGLPTTRNPLASDPDGGESVLIYPGDASQNQPIPSARLEQIRDGIEDWEIFNIVRQRYGAARVRTILGQAGLFSSNADGVKLACIVGCDLHGPAPDAWPVWSHDATTPARIETARLAALRSASES